MIFNQLIQSNLETRLLGKRIEYHNRLESTNTEALQLLEGGAMEGTVVITDNQTSGRGRMGRTWFSGPGKGLAFSVILKPEIKRKIAGLFPLISGIATMEAISKLQLSPNLKWPNDILLSGKKCGGILVQSRFRGDVIVSAIVGIGINVNERLAELPENLQPTSTSIAIEKGTSVQRELLMAWMLNSLETWYKRLKSWETTSIISAWQHHCAHLGNQVSFTHKGKNLSGIFTGVAEDGEAIIETDSGRLLLSAEEISLYLE